MSNQVLYRVYRPTTFKDVVGQDHIVSVLEKSATSGKIAHAYLFSGPRGTGKTSLARIFAKAIGCDQNDIYEIDAASNRGIDEIRELRDGVMSLPMVSRYKVYIIDEVHMLTKEAWNALLKTLEEPPAHVIFILATTESHKIPETIISRCQSFAFKRPTEEIIASRLDHIAKNEGFKIDKSAISLIAILGDGSFRDAIGILQKVATLSGDKVLTEDEVSRVTGAPKTEAALDFIEKIIKGDRAGAMKIVVEIEEQGFDITIFTKFVLSRIRYLVLLMHAPDLENHVILQTSKKEYEKLKLFTKEPQAKRASAILKEFLGAFMEMGRVYVPSAPLLVAIVNSTELQTKT